MSRHVNVTALSGAMALVILGTGCGGAAAVAPAAKVTVLRGAAAREPTVSEAPYGAADTQFGLRVLASLCRANPGGNVVISPASLASSLGMAYLGARGATARDMASVLRPPATGQALLAGLAGRSRALARLSGPGVTLTQANEVWANPGMPPVRSFLNAVATGYGAGLRQVPLARDPAQAASAINAAIAAGTGGHITHLLSAGMLDDIAWVLTDAMYLDARWEQPFKRASTHGGTFRAPSGPVPASFMSGGGYDSSGADGWQAVALPYRGGKLEMLALLPPTGQTGCPDLAPPALRALTGGLTAADGGTTVDLPKVSLQTSTNMIPALTGLGMGQAFSQSADFAGLSPGAGPIGLVQQAATLRVAEGGTVASAATATGIQPLDARTPTPPIVFDRPYLLLVRDTATGEPLFLARVANPASP